MTTSFAPVRRPTRRRVLYWVFTGLLCAVFTGSGLLFLLDPDGAAQSYLRYGYPGRLTLVYAVGVAKLAAVVLVLSGHWPLLRTFAMAGLLFDLLLALEAHASLRDTFGLVAMATLVFWVGAFTADRAGWRSGGAR